MGFKTHWIYDIHVTRYSCLIVSLRETSFTLRGATQGMQNRMKIRIHVWYRNTWNIQFMARSNLWDARHNGTTTFTFDSGNTRNVIYLARNNPWDAKHNGTTTFMSDMQQHMKPHLHCAEQQESHCNIPKYRACHEKWLSWLILVTDEASFTLRGATGLALQRHQILRLPLKMTFRKLSKLIWETNLLKTAADASFTVADDSKMIRTWSDHDPSMKLQNWTRLFAELTFPPSATHFVLKITTLRFRLSISKFHQMLRLPRKVTLQHHQIVCPPQKMIPMIDPGQTWNVQYNARSNRSHPPTSPNIVPPTKNDFRIDPRIIWYVQYKGRSNRAHPPTSPKIVLATKNGFHDWSSYETSFTSTLRGATGVTFQRHQRLRLPQNMTFQNIRQIFRERMKRHLQWETIQTWSENDPSMNWGSCRTWPFGEVTFRALDAFSVEKCNILLLLMLWILQGFFIVRRWWRWALLRGNPDPRPLPKGIIVVCRKINERERKGVLWMNKMNSKTHEQRRGTSMNHEWTLLEACGRMGLHVRLRYQCPFLVKPRIYVLFLPGWPTPCTCKFGVPDWSLATWNFRVPSLALRVAFFEITLTQPRLAVLNDSS